MSNELAGIYAIMIYVIATGDVLPAFLRGLGVIE